MEGTYAPLHSPGITASACVLPSILFWHLYTPLFFSLWYEPRVHEEQLSHHSSPSTFQTKTISAFKEKYLLKRCNPFSY